MKDLKLDKESLIKLCVDQSAVIGGNNDNDDYVSCPRKTCANKEDIDIEL